MRNNMQAEQTITLFGTVRNSATSPISDLAASAQPSESRSSQLPQPQLPRQDRRLRQAGPLRSLVAEGHSHRARCPDTVPAGPRSSPHCNLRASDSASLRRHPPATREKPEKVCRPHTERYINGINLPFILESHHNRQYNAVMSALSFRSIDELQTELGNQVQALRLSKNLDQVTTAEKAGISEKALRNLETGRGSSIESFVRVLKALDSLNGLELLVPKPSVSPLALLRNSRTRQRARRSLAKTSEPA